MRHEVRRLRQKAFNSLLLAIEHFNRPNDVGRAEAVLILLDHGFEMLLKASIRHRGGRIWESDHTRTLSSDACVRKALTDGGVKFLSEGQALTLQNINGLRDAAQHHLLEIPEDQLYIHAQAGVTLFADILKFVFGDPLVAHLPERVLPISTRLPTTFALLVEREVDCIRTLLRPGVRQRLQARARIRALAIVEAATQGQGTQLSDKALDKLLRLISGNTPWDDVFPGVASLVLSVEGDGIPFSIRIDKKADVAVHLVPEGTSDASVVAVRRVDELGYYSLGHAKVAEQVGLSQPKTTAIIRKLGIQSESDCFKIIRIDGSSFGRYSAKAVERIRAELPGLDIDEVWKEHRPRRNVFKGRQLL